jgi:hypothetical protein
MSIRIPKCTGGWCPERTLRLTNLLIINFLLATFIEIISTSENIFIKIFSMRIFYSKKIGVADTREKVRACAHVPNSGIWQFSQFCENAHSYPPSAKFVQKSAQIGQKVVFLDQKNTLFF